MSLFYLLLFLIIVIVAIYGVKVSRKAKELREDGKIIAREYHFADKGEEFTSKIGSFENLANELKQMQVPCAVNGSASTEVIFSTNQFSARLYKVDFDEPSGIAIYRFQFSHWKEVGDFSSYEDPLGMNQVMTAVEKAFLNLDPNTGVKEYKNEVETKRTIF